MNNIQNKNITTIYAKKNKKWIHIFWVEGKIFQLVTNEGELVLKYVMALGLGPFYHPEFPLMTYPVMPCLQCYGILNFNSWAEHICQSKERQDLDKLIKYDQDFRMK